MDINNIFDPSAQTGTFIIAELSANHGGKLEIALDTVRAAKRTGADAIKIQTYSPDTITLNSDKADFQINQGTQWDGQTLYNLYNEAMLPWEWHKAIFEEAKKIDLICFSSPFDETAVDFLEELQNPIYKIASFEIKHIPLIKKVAKTGKPIIISTGIAEKEDIELALHTCFEENNTQIALLKCTSAYPAPIEETNLTMIEKFREEFKVVTGLSDHTLGIEVPILAIGFGAKVIEKHFILDKSVGGPDAAFSLDVEEFSQMVKSVRNAEKAIGKIDFSLSGKSKTNSTFGRSIYISKNVKKGDVLSTENIKVVRPGFGLEPKHYDKVLGKKFTVDAEIGTRLSFDIIE